MPKIRKEKKRIKKQWGDNSIDMHIFRAKHKLYKINLLHSKRQSKLLGYKRKPEPNWSNMNLGALLSMIPHTNYHSQRGNYTLPQINMNL